MTPPQASSSMYATPKRRQVSETGDTYSVEVSTEDYFRAQADGNYANELLQQVKRTLGQEGNDADVDKAKNDEPHNKRAVWDQNGILALINSMEAHHEDLNNFKKRKFVFDNISNELVGLKMTYTPIECKLKWKSLLRTYKQAKDNKRKTGRGPTRFDFFELIDNFLCDKEANACSHIIDSGNMMASSSSSQNSIIVNASNYESVLNENNNETLFNISNSETLLNNRNSETLLSDSNSETLPKKRKKSGINTTLEKLLLMKEEEYERRNLRHREKMEIEKKKKRKLDC